MTIPKRPETIKRHIKKYESALRAEKRTYGDYDDSAGLRYVLGPFYMLAGDNDGALKSFRWFAREFSDDVGEPAQYVCWALALYRSGDADAARQKLIQVMFMNLYLIPSVVGLDEKEADMWYSTNLERKDYVEYIPQEFFEMWDDEERKWAEAVHTDAENVAARARFVQLRFELGNASGRTTTRQRILSELRAFERAHGI